PKCGRHGATKQEIPPGAKVRCPVCRTVTTTPIDETISAAFTTLNLPTNATAEQVKEAFRDLAQVWHPDRFAHNLRLSAQAETKMREINHAYELLRDHLAVHPQESVNDPKSSESTSAINLDEFIDTLLASQTDQPIRPKPRGKLKSTDVSWL